MGNVAFGWIAALGGIGAGALVTWLSLRGRLAEGAGARARAVELAQATERVRGFEAERARQESACAKLEASARVDRQEIARLTGESERLRAELGAERRSAAEKLQVLEQARESLTNQFKVTAAQIFEEKTQKLTAQTKQTLDPLLDPLKLQLQAFQAKVEEVYVAEGKDRSALKGQVEQLMALNQKLSSDAHQLTAALKGSNKAQGNWGELVLSRILESAGLREGKEYTAQESHVRDDGTRAQPDVVIHLPEGKRLVVDSKVSLTAYQRAVSADDPAERAAAMAEHVDSVRGHIKGLSAKGYQKLHEGEAIDFVVMFVAVEPAFMWAIEADPALWQDAWERSVLLVSPSTLLFVLRTVAHLWRQERQTQNAHEIAKRGAALYDKLAGFVEALDGVGAHLERAQKSFADARAKLATGNGNALRQAELLVKLGVKPTKKLPKGDADDAQGEPAPALGDGTSTG